MLHYGLHFFDLFIVLVPTSLTGYRASIDLRGFNLDTAASASLPGLPGTTVCLWFLPQDHGVIVSPASFLWEPSCPLRMFQLGGIGGIWSLI